MKKQLLTIFSLFLFVIINAQTVAYNATYEGFNNIDCINLSYVDAEVRGHQINVTVDYFLTLTDAQNNTNRLPIYYEFLSDNQVLYTRVTNNTDATFATSTITLALFPFTCCPPPPNGIIDYSICDIDSDGSEIVYLDNLRSQSGNIYPNSLFCGLFDNEINITYHLTNSDAQNGINPINEIYTLAFDTDIFYKITNTSNSEEVIHIFGLSLINCPPNDSDTDGIDDAAEDANRNGDFTDDDTDNDGIKNYLDNDDDGDGILTINEDFNNNGDPTDDDVNGNSIPDYLEFSVTLSNIEFNDDAFSFYPNPVKDVLTFVLDENIMLLKVSIVNINGRIVKKETITASNSKLNMSNLSSGIYFIDFEMSKKRFRKKIIKQ